MKEAIIIVVVLCIMLKFDELISKIRSEKLRYTLSFIMYGVTLLTSIYLKMKVLPIICIMVILSNVADIDIRKKRAKELQEEQRKQDKRDGVAYTLKESEYREID